MRYCLYNAIKTPDGNILCCQSANSLVTYTDTISHEEYLVEDRGNRVCLSTNVVPYEELSVFSDDPFEKVRTIKCFIPSPQFNKGTINIVSLEEMDDEYITHILENLKNLNGNELVGLYFKEFEYRVQLFKEKLDKDLPSDTKDKKKKVKV